MGETLWPPFASGLSSSSRASIGQASAELGLKGTWEMWSPQLGLHREGGDGREPWLRGMPFIPLGIVQGHLE